MAYEFKRLGEVEALSEVPENANALIEIDGNIKRVPGNGLGGAGVKTAIIKDSIYDEALAYFTQANTQSTLVGVVETAYECINMTFNEAYETMANGAPLNVVGMLTGEGAMSVPGVVVFLGAEINSTPCIMVMFVAGETAIATLYWTADGLSTEAPSDGK